MGNNHQKFQDAKKEDKKLDYMQMTWRLNSKDISEKLILVNFHIIVAHVKKTLQRQTLGTSSTDQAVQDTLT